MGRTNLKLDDDLHQAHKNRKAKGEDDDGLTWHEYQEWLLEVTRHLEPGVLPNPLPGQEKTQGPTTTVEVDTEELALAVVERMAQEDSLFDVSVSLEAEDLPPGIDNISGMNAEEFAETVADVTSNRVTDDVLTAIERMSR